MGLLTVVSLGVAQLFALSTRANVIAQGPDLDDRDGGAEARTASRSHLGLRPGGQGLPVSDTTTNLTVYPPTHERLGPESVAGRLARAEHRRVRRFPRRGRRLGRHRQHAARRRRSTSAAGRFSRCRRTRTTRWSSRCWSRRSTNEVARVARRVHAHPDGGRRAARDGEDEESVMTSSVPSRARVGSRVHAHRAARVDRDHGHGHRRDLLADESGAGQRRRRSRKSPTCSSACASGTTTLFKELVMAGAGLYQGPVTGSLINFFAPIIPRRSGASEPGSGAPVFQDRRDHADVHPEQLFADDDQRRRCRRSRRS